MKYKCIIHFLPAEEGDCFVLEFDNKSCILIDSGYKSTYKNELKPLLVQLREKNCEISLMVITHADKDHIDGAIELIKENGNVKEPKIIPIKNIWYNGYVNTLLKQECIAARKRTTLSADMAKAIGSFSQQVFMNTSVDKTNISALLARSFELECSKQGYVMNKQFKNGIAMREFETIEEKKYYEKVIDEVHITVLNPSKNELTGWAKELDKYFKKSFGRNYEVDNSKEYVQMIESIQKLLNELYVNGMPISHSGNSLKSWIGTSSLAPMNSANRVSIVLEIAYKGAKMLFMGDSESADWITFSDKNFDIVKVSHHGTLKPNSSLLQSINPTSLMISTNGSRDDRHPEKDFLARAILEYKTPHIYFNYNLSNRQVLEENQVKFDFQATYEQRIIVIGE